MKIHIVDPSGIYESTIDPGASDVRIQDAFRPVLFVADNGDVLTIKTTNIGFEVTYATTPGWKPRVVQFEAREIKEMKDI